MPDIDGVVELIAPRGHEHNHEGTPEVLLPFAIKTQVTARQVRPRVPAFIPAVALVGRDAADLERRVTWPHSGVVNRRRLGRRSQGFTRLEPDAPEHFGLLDTRDSYSLRLSRQNGVPLSRTSV